MLLTETQINHNRYCRAYHGCARGDWAQVTCPLGVSLRGGRITEDRDVEQQISERAQRGAVGEREKGRSQGSLCSGRDGTSETWRLDFPGEPQREGCFRRGSSGDSKVWEEGWAHLAGTLTACALGKNDALGVDSNEEEPPKSSVRPLVVQASEGWGRSSLKGLQVCVGTTAFPDCPDLDVQGGYPERSPAWWRQLGLAALAQDSPSPEGPRRLLAAPLCKGPESGRTLVTHYTLTCEQTQAKAPTLWWELPQS